ncbi:MAG: quinolinate synthase NadA [Bacteroidales bacterium]|nr:quinolinate synthase NadA [Bacteroidales bacterium]
MTREELVQKIEELKKQKNAIVLAHYYSNPEVQDVADFLGDSLELSRKAGTADADIIVFAGVHFMAETAALISPKKKVLVPALGAGCTLADGVCGKNLAEWKTANPNGMVVSYVNTTAEVKSHTDICCTSANALSIVKGLPQDTKVFFVPDKNLGAYIISQTGRDMELYDGCCKVHDQVTTSMVQEMMAKYPEADVLIHPESACSSDPAILENPNCYMYSTSGILKHAAASEKKQFIIATEVGTLHKLRKDNPGKEFIPVSEKIVCEYMKLATLEKVYEALRDEKFEVKVPEEISGRALEPITLMMSK